MKDEMLRFITEQTQVSMVQLVRHLGKDAKGTCEMTLGELVLWVNVSEMFVTALSELHKERLISMTPTVLLTYIVDGGYLPLPIAKRKVSYKEPHWLPVVLNATKVTA